MRYAITLATAVIIGFGLKAYFSPPTAIADVTSVTIDTFEMQRNSEDFPVHKFHDRSFVFSEAN